MKEFISEILKLEKLKNILGSETNQFFFAINKN